MLAAVRFSAFYSILVDLSFAVQSIPKLEFILQYYTVVNVVCGSGQTAYNVCGWSIGSLKIIRVMYTKY